MDEHLARLNRIYPNGHYVEIPAYNPELFKDRAYDSSFDSKAAVNRWKTNPLSYEEAQDLVSQGKRIGWVIPKGYVIIDIDNKDDARAQTYLEKLLHKFEVKYSYNYTSKGIHILFKDPTEDIKSDSRTKCALNILIDTRANASGYIVLPCNDPHRQWGKWGDYVEDLPYFLRPLMKDNTPSFIGMTDGDGRNDALFKWRSQLERCNKLTNEEIEKSIRIINENLFDIAIPNNELFKTVLREKETKKQQQLIKKENPYNKIADDIVGKYDFAYYYGNFYKFNGIYYEAISDVDMERLIHFEVDPNIAQAGRKEIIEFIKIKTEVDINDFNKDWYKIACKNGVLNLMVGELEQPNKCDINTISIPINYNPDPVYSPRIDQFMKDLTNGDVIKMQFLYQIAGYCLLKKNVFEKFVICKGEGGTGKSTYTNLLHRMVGGDVNCSHIGLGDFNKEYYIVNLHNKLLNIDDDVADAKFLENTGRFKSIISGNTISARQIFKTVLDFRPFATCIFSCNRLPKIMDKTSGLYRRMILIELNHKIEKPDPQFMTKVTDSDMEYFLFKAVEGIKTALEEGHFRITQSEQHLLDMFKRRQNPLNEWLYELGFTLGDLHMKKCITLFRQFTEWYEQNGHKGKMSSFTFKEDICALYDMDIRSVQTEGTTIPQQVFYKPGNFNKDFKPF